MSGTPGRPRTFFRNRNPIRHRRLRSSTSHLVSLLRLLPDNALLARADVDFRFLKLGADIFLTAPTGLTTRCGCRVSHGGRVTWGLLMPAIHARRPHLPFAHRLARPLRRTHMQDGGRHDGVSL